MVCIASIGMHLRVMERIVRLDEYLPVLDYISAYWYVLVLISIICIDLRQLNGLQISMYSCIHVSYLCLYVLRVLVGIFVLVVIQLYLPALCVLTCSINFNSMDNYSPALIDLYCSSIHNQYLPNTESIIADQYTPVIPRYMPKRFLGTKTSVLNRTSISMYWVSIVVCICF